jgi:hypothetical protein
MLNALGDAEGCYGSTIVEAGVYVTTPEGTKQMSRDSIKIIDGKVYCEIKIDGKFRALTGADHPNAHPLEHNSFLTALRKSRHDATTALLAAAHEASFVDPSSAPTKFIRKFLMEDIKTTIDVLCPGFVTSGGEVVPEVTISMLTAQYHNSRIWFELGPRNFEYVRLGVRHTMFDVPTRKRKDKSAPPDFVGCPAARLRDDRCGVYCRVRNADGKWSVKTFPVKYSDVNEILTSRHMDAAIAAQSHFDTHHVAATERKTRGKKSRDSSNAKEEEGSNDDEEVTVEEEDGNVAVEEGEGNVAVVEDGSNETASASGVNRGAAEE